jgi:stage V sporulation protein G
MITVTEVQIEFITPHEGLIAFATVVVNDCIRLSSIAVHQKLSGGFRLTYPVKGKFNIFHPINKETSETIEEAIFQKLKNVINEDCNKIVYDRHDKNSNSL